MFEIKIKYCVWDMVSSFLTYLSPIGKNQDLDPVPKMFFFFLNTGK